MLMRSKIVTSADVHRRWTSNECTLTEIWYLIQMKDTHANKEFDRWYLCFIISTYRLSTISSIIISTWYKWRIHMQIKYYHYYFGAQILDLLLKPRTTTLFALPQIRPDHSPVFQQYSVQVHYIDTWQWLFFFLIKRTCW
jgi:hypothetical protein